MMGERYVPQEALEMGEPKERVLEGEDRERFLAELSEYAAGIEAALQDPDLSDDDRAELEEQLAGFRDSLEAAEAGGPITVKE